MKKNKIDFCFGPNNPFVSAAVRKNNILVHGVQSQDHHTFSILPNIGDISFFLSNDQIFKYKSKPKKFLVTGLPQLDKEYLKDSKSQLKKNFKLPKKSVISATTDYSSKIVCSIERDNLFGTQFHPEKSDKTGLKIIDNFLKL